MYFIGFLVYIPSRLTYTFIIVPCLCTFLTEATLKPPGEPLEEEEVTASSGEAVSSCLVLLGEDNEVCL